jgi:hypothetical protein
MNPKLKSLKGGKVFLDLEIVKRSITKSIKLSEYEDK